MKNKKQIVKKTIPAVIAAILLVTVTVHATGGNGALGNPISIQGKNSQAYQQAIVPIEDSQPSLASRLVGTWKSGDETVVIRSDLTATWSGNNDGHIEVVSGNKFHYVAADKSIVDFNLVDNNTISYGALSFASDAPDVRLHRQ